MPRPFTEVLVPLDGSRNAERAVAPARELASRTNVPIRLVQRGFVDDKEAAAAYLVGVADRCTGVRDVRTELLDGDRVADTILDALGPGTLVCMSSHGRGGLARAVIGSVAEAVLRSVGRPVLVVGPHLAESRPFGGRVVACVDGSAEAERTLRPARRWADLLGLPLWVAEVVTPGQPPGRAPGGDVAESGYVARLARRFGRIDGWDVLHDRQPGRALAGLARPDGDAAGLLVLATHGRAGWNRVRLGSVTAATIRAATVPVLVVPARRPLR